MVILKANSYLRKKRNSIYKIAFCFIMIIMETGIHTNNLYSSECLGITMASLK